MNKPELIKEMSLKVEGSTLKETEAFLDAFINSVKEALQRDEKVALVGFGSFETKETKEREVFKDPRNKELGKKILPKGKKLSAKLSKTILK